MEQSWKIWTEGLPQAVVSALAEQLGAEAGFAGAPEAADVFLTLPGEEAVRLRQLHPAVPQLELTFARPLRLGLLLRQIGNIVSDPGLWLEEVPVCGYILHPQDKVITDPAGADIPLTDKEVEILIFLARHHRRAVGRDELLRHVWRYQQGVDTHTLETHIYRLRQKLGDAAENAQLLLTEEGGYRLNLEGAQGKS